MVRARGRDGMARFRERRNFLRRALDGRRHRRRLAAAGLCVAALGGIAIAAAPAPDRRPFQWLRIAGSCQERPNGAWADYVGELVARNAARGGGVTIYGKVLQTDLPEVKRGAVKTGMAGPFAVVFPKLRPAQVAGSRFRLEGVSEHLALDKAAQPIRGRAVCNLTVVERQPVG